MYTQYTRFSSIICYYIVFPTVHRVNLILFCSTYALTQTSDQKDLKLFHKYMKYYYVVYSKLTFFVLLFFFFNNILYGLSKHIFFYQQRMLKGIKQCIIWIIKPITMCLLNSQVASQQSQISCVLLRFELSFKRDFICEHICSCPSPGIRNTT